MRLRTWWAWCSGVVLLLNGCGQGDQSALDTGARDCAQSYIDAMLLRDFAHAYAALDPTSQKKCGMRQYRDLATSYLSSFGFDPDKAHVRSCEEHGASATAHIVFTGHTSTHERWHKDGILLHNDGTGWRVVLPAKFGQTRKR